MPFLGKRPPVYLPRPQEGTGGGSKTRPQIGSVRIAHTIGMIGAERGQVEQLVALLRKLSPDTSTIVRCVDVVKE